MNGYWLAFTKFTRIVIKFCECKDVDSDLPDIRIPMLNLDT